VASPTLTVIGLDAMTPLVLEPLRAAGAIPHLDRLLGQGASGVLRSTTHPLTPQAWTTMFTGVGAGRHGIWDFHERDESGYGLRPVNGSYRREPAVWQRLSAAGRRVGVINVPFTWPVDDVNGFALAGFDAYGRRDGFATPAGLLEELEGHFGPLVQDHAFPVMSDGRIDLEQVRRVAEQRVELTLWLAERFDPELLVVVFMAADHAHHLGWDEWERSGAASPLAQVYGILDEAVGALAGALGGDIMLVSDHGAGPLNGVVNLNAWLAERGLLEYAGTAELMRGGQVQRMAAARALGLWRRLPLDLRTRVKQRLGGLRERSYELQNYSVVDFERTQAFAYGTFGNIVVNVQGRERTGTVAPGAEYEAVREAIASGLRELRDPASGRPIVAAVHRREELFSGPQLERVPDLVVEFVDYEWLGKGNLKSRTETIWDRVEIAGTDAAYVGSHRHEGIVALSGPSAAPGGLFASIEDIAPTIQYLLGEPIPESMEGRLIDAAIDPALLESRPPAYAAGEVELSSGVRVFADDEAGEVQARLRGLGYIE
jgi:predicted AlkP superfamily phosphohydrolase/phosphomutase